MHGNVRDDSEQHRITLTSVQKWTQDFIERFPKSEWSYNIGVYGSVFCLDKSTWSPSFKVRIAADQRGKNRWICVHLVSDGAGAKDSEGVQSIGPRMRLGTYIIHDLNLFSWTSVILLFYAVNELLSVETKIYECFAFAMIFLRDTDLQNGHIPKLYFYRRSERRLLNSLVFTSSVVENYWEN